MNNNENSPTLTVENLRKQGYKVKINHYRYSQTSFKQRRAKPTLYLRKTNLPKFNPHACGGKTTAEIVKNGVVLKGTSICHKEDNFNRKEGVKYALQNAFNIERPKTEIGIIARFVKFLIKLVK